MKQPTETQPNMYYVDAGTKGNGTQHQDSVIAVTNLGGELLFERHVGFMTNNEAEYTALSFCLLYLIERNIQGPIIMSDSKLVVNQVSGKWKCKSEHLKQYQSAARLLVEKANATVKWVPRSYNRAGIYLEKKYRV